MRKPSWTLRAVFTVLTLAIAACGGASHNVKYTPLTPEQERVFEHGVDFVAALEGLEGRWREDWDRDLQERVGGADFIGVIEVVTLLTETDPEQQVTHRLVGKVKRAIYGDHDGDLELRVRADQPGFSTVHDNLQRIDRRQFVAFVKWYRDDRGDQAAHFHLSPASAQVVGQTEATAALRSSGNKPSNERVVVHTH